MTKHRIHYLTDNAEARCGIPRPRNWTFTPAKVTCGNCNRLMGKEVK